MQKKKTCHCIAIIHILNVGMLQPGCASVASIQPSRTWTSWSSKVDNSEVFRHLYQLFFMITSVTIEQNKTKKLDVWRLSVNQSLSWSIYQLLFISQIWGIQEEWVPNGFLSLCLLPSQNTEGHRNAETFRDCDHLAIDCYSHTNFG